MRAGVEVGLELRDRGEFVGVGVGCVAEGAGSLHGFFLHHAEELEFGAGREEGFLTRGAAATFAPFIAAFFILEFVVVLGAVLEGFDECAEHAEGGGEVSGEGLGCGAGAKQRDGVGHGLIEAFVGVVEDLGVLEAVGLGAEFVEHGAEFVLGVAESAEGGAFATADGLADHGVCAGVDGGLLFEGFGVGLREFFLGAVGLAVGGGFVELGEFFDGLLEAGEAAALV